MMVKKVLQMHGNLKELLIDICSFDSIDSTKSTWFNKKPININNFVDLKYFVEESYNQLLAHYPDLNQLPWLNINDCLKKLTAKKIGSYL